MENVSLLPKKQEVVKSVMEQEQYESQAKEQTEK